MSRYAKGIYLDHAATTPVRPEVFHAMKPYLTTEYGNPSAAYGLGERSTKGIAYARAQIAKAIHANSYEIYFTSGGTESDNWALKGAIDYARLTMRQDRCHVITSSIEHAAIKKSAEYLEKRGVVIDYLAVDSDGLINLFDMEQKMNSSTSLVSIMFANNEIGTIEPVEDIGALCRKYAVPFHTDAVQAIGQVPIDVDKMHIDLLSASAHKFGGPKGIGFLYVKKGCNLEPYIHGGGQERGYRSGTENVANIVGLGKAIELADRELEWHIQYVSALRNKLKVALQLAFPDCIVNGVACEEGTARRLPNNLNITIPGLNAQELIAYFDKHNICISAGSACSAHRMGGSHVLDAIGVDKELQGSTIRMTLGLDNDWNQLEYMIYLLQKYMKK